MLTDNCDELLACGVRDAGLYHDMGVVVGELGDIVRGNGTVILRDVERTRGREDRCRSLWSHIDHAGWVDSEVHAREVALKRRGRWEVGRPVRVSQQPPDF